MYSRESLVDDSIPGQKNTVITVDLIYKVDGLVRNDCHVTLRILAEKVDASVGTMWIVVFERLRYRKVCEHWVPKRFTDQEKELSMRIAFQRLCQYHKDPFFPGASASKVLFTVFFDVQGPLLLNSSSTESPLPPMYTVRQSKAYAGPSRTNDRSCSRKV